STHADEEQRSILRRKIAKLLQFCSDGGIAAIRFDQIAKACRLLAALNLQGLSGRSLQQLFRRLDAGNPARRLFGHLLHCMVLKVLLINYSLVSWLTPVKASLSLEVGLTR